MNDGDQFWNGAAIIMLLAFGWHPIGWLVLAVFGIVWLIRKFNGTGGNHG